MHLADYYAMITHLDEGIGRIHAALEAAGLSDDTLVIHTADHGLAVGCHGLMGKQSLYDHSTRVPLIVAGPGFERDAVDDRLCYQHDLHPTLLAAAGLNNPDCEYEHLHAATRRAYVACSYSHTMRSIRDPQYKLIEYDLPGGRRSQLFDTTSDPLEINDLSQHAQLADVQNRLKTALQDHMAKTDDPLRERFA
jgi:arylsulfatase A-like enzyme